MSSQLRIPSPWTQLGIFFGLFGAGFVFTAIIMVIFGIASGNISPDIAGSDPSDISKLKTMQGMSSITIFLLPSVVFALIVYFRKIPQNLGFKRVRDLRMIVISIAVILLGFPFLYLLSEINSLVPLPQWMIEMEERTAEQLMEFLKVENFGDILINLLIIAVLPAICEEVCFRGALQPILIRITKNPVTGIILASIIFSALHLQFQGFLPRFYLGVVLGMLYWYSGSLWPSILAHFINNGVQVVMVAYSPEYVNENPDMPLWLGAVSGVLIGGMMYLYMKWSDASYTKMAASESTPQNHFSDNP